jgi:hypothetical protein
MPNYLILKEITPGDFEPTGETFAGTADEAQAHIEALQAADPQCKCYAATAATP